MKRCGVILLVLSALLAVLILRMPEHRRLQLHNLLEQVPSIPARYVV